MSAVRPLLSVHESPDGRWSVEVNGPTEVAPEFYAVFEHDGQAFIGFPFGYAAPTAMLKVRWDLPDSVCGLYLGEDCYALFRWGPRRRRRRESYCTGHGNHFGDDEIRWFCAKKRVQQRRSTQPTDGTNAAGDSEGRDE
jgi:hypothetical protein